MDFDVELEAVAQGLDALDPEPVKLLNVGEATELTVFTRRLAGDPHGL